MSIAAVERGKLDIGKVIQGTFQVLGRNFVTFSVLGLVFYGVPMLAFSLVQRALGGAVPSFTLATVIWSIFGVFVIVVASAVLQGALIHATVQDMNGTRPTVGGSIATGLRAFLPLIGVSIGFSVIAGIGFLLLIVPGLMIACAWAVAVPALIADRTGVDGAFRRSADLTRGNRWRVFGLGAIAYVAALLIGLVFLQISGINAFAPDPTRAQAAALSPLMLGLNLVTNVLTSVISSTGIAVLYVELRRLRDGGGTQWLAEIFS